MALFPAFPGEDYRSHQEAVDAAIARVLRSGDYILGPELQAFEAEFAAFTGTAFAVGVANGTDAIELLLRGLGIGHGDAVVTPSHTAVATASGVFRAGALPVFADIEESTFTLAPDAVRQLLKSEAGRSVKAIVAVHIYGHPCDMEGLRQVAEEYGVVLLEDCAQAHGAEWRGHRVGGLARGAAFSFYPTKNLGAMGDGGAITTEDEALAARVRVLRQYGWERRYVSDAEGVNSRLDEMQAAVLRVKLATLSERLDRRRQLAGRYAHLLASEPCLRLPATRPDCAHGWHLYVARSEARDALFDHLAQHGVPVARHYPAAIHQQPAYAAHARRAALPVTERVVRQILTLPLHPYLPEEAQDRVAEVLRSFHASSPAGRK